ncbi:hopanoid biosynthesis associated radical SAM protein HpnJ [bacterium]|nr:hopanoid biosynthesis associated radical SAM protein HpnJ [bacterium]
MLKTLFLNPPSFEGFDGGAGARYQAKREIKSFWYPTWLAQPAAILGEQGRLVDAPANEWDVEKTMKIGRGFDMAILHTSTPSFANDVKVAERLKQERPGIKIGFCGAHVAVMPEQSLRASSAIDFVCGKEFDFTIAEVAEGRAFCDIDGLSYRNEQGSIVHNKERGLIHDMDTLPSVLDVYKRDLTIENYFIGYLQHPYVSLYTGRGCPARCTFCLWPQTVGGHNYRTQSAGYVIEEMAKAKEYFPRVKEFFFDDDTFTADLRRTEEIARGLGKLGITWSCNSRANVPYETLKVMKENGLRLLLVGYESANEQILINIKKGVKKSRYLKFAKDVKDLGIITHGTFIVGLPGETKETLEETMQFACDIDPETIQVSLAAPYPGTFLYDQAIREGWLDAPKLEHIDGLGQQTAAIGYRDLPTEAIAEALETFYKRFYFRWKPISRIVKEMLEDRRVMMRRLREGKEFFTFMLTRK